MLGINGVQLARLWARAWKDRADKDGFRKLLGENPRQAAKIFREECIKNQYADFPDLSSDETPLLDLGEYEHEIVIFKNIPPDRLDKIIKKNEPMEWTKSGFIKPDDLREALLKGEREIY